MVWSWGWGGCESQREGLLFLHEFHFSLWSYLALFIFKTSFQVLFTSSRTFCKQDIIWHSWPVPGRRLCSILPFIFLLRQVGIFWKGAGQCSVILSSQRVLWRTMFSSSLSFTLFHHHTCSFLGLPITCPAADFFLFFACSLTSVPSKPWGSCCYFHLVNEEIKSQGGWVNVPVGIDSKVDVIPRPTRLPLLC